MDQFINWLIIWFWYCLSAVETMYSHLKLAWNFPPWFCVHLTNLETDFKKHGTTSLRNVWCGYWRSTLLNNSEFIWRSLRLTSLVIRLLVQKFVSDIMRKIEAQYFLPFARESTSQWWIPHATMPIFRKTYLCHDAIMKWSTGIRQ